MSQSSLSLCTHQGIGRSSNPRLRLLMRLSPLKCIVLLQLNRTTILFLNKALYSCRRATSGSVSQWPEINFHLSRDAFSSAHAKCWKTLRTSCILWKKSLYWIVIQKWASKLCERKKKSIKENKEQEGFSRKIMTGTVKMNVNHLQ